MLSEGTEQVMAERRGRIKDRPAYDCHGVCGRTLRPWRRSVAQFPNTTMEYSANRCIGCWHLWMREQNPEDPAFALSPCPGCGTITRPDREPLSTAPGTLRRTKTGQCTDCTGPSGSKASTEHIARGLENFLATMRANAKAVKARGWN